MSVKMKKNLLISNDVNASFVAEAYIFTVRRRVLRVVLYYYYYYYYYYHMIYIAPISRIESEALASLGGERD